MGHGNAGDAGGVEFWTGLRDFLSAGCFVVGGCGTEQTQLVQPPDPPHGPGVRSGQLGDLHPETAKVASLVDQLADMHVIRRVPAGGQQDQPDLALRLEEAGRVLHPLRPA